MSVAATRVTAVPPISDASSPDRILADVGARTLALALRTRAMTDAAVGEPSRLPGWTRGHVLAHLAYNADAFAGALERARTQDDAGLMYPSREARDLDIETDATRSASGHLDGVLGSGHRLACAWSRLPADRLAVPVSGNAGWRRPVAHVPWMRWRELALHAVDLGWPADFLPGDPLVGRLLVEVGRDWVARDDAPPVAVHDVERDLTMTIGDGGGVRVEGSSADLALWLTGRSLGTGLQASGPLPAMPPWL